MHAPLFWKEKNALSSALLPLSAIYGLASRMRRTSGVAVKLPVPVICVGNLTVGGTGKTPVALALGEILKREGIELHFLLRGYKGRLKGPERVKPDIHTAEDVGDEALLLAEIAPTWVAADRALGAKAAAESGAGCILMDDGYQNPSVHKDLSLLVIDGEYGFGNERLLPAGPLRESIELGMSRASAIVLLGEDRHHALRHRPGHLPVLPAEIRPLPEAQELSGKPVVAFAGIGRPRKFYRTLRALGCQIRKTVSYPDHYLFRPRDIAYLQRRAKELGAILVTTAKDYVRLPPGARGDITPLPVEVVFADLQAVARLLHTVK